LVPSSIVLEKETPPMKRYLPFCVPIAAGALAHCSDDDKPSSPSASPSPPSMSFFVSSTVNPTGNLGGLAGADGRCQSLAAAAGFGRRTWRAYLSVERDPADPTRALDARSRIGSGPWYNARGTVVAMGVDELHMRRGDSEVFLDERGQKINGQWTGSPSPNQHDILTGSTQDGRVMAGATCADWTSDSGTQAAQVGHSDGLGPNQSTTGTLASWNSAHANLSCADTAPRGGAGRIYCFAIN
jgi:hypothetical protein